jgi:hypothetical protein
MDSKKLMDFLNVKGILDGMINEINPCTYSWGLCWNLKIAATDADVEEVMEESGNGAEKKKAFKRLYFLGPI